MGVAVVIRRPCTKRWGAVAVVGLMTSTPLGAQEVIEMTGEDRRMNADFEEVFRIGSIDGDTWETFGEVAGMAFDGDGNLYVFDRQSSFITMVDREGNFVRDIGSPGEGPGEFRMALQFTVMRDGRLVVADMGHRSYQLFDADGEFDRMVSMGGGGMIRIGDLAPHPSGDALISGGGGMVMMEAGPGGAPSVPETRPIDRISLAGDEAVSTVIAEGWKPARPEGGTTLEGGGMRFNMAMAGPRTFEPGLLVGALPDGGVVFSDSSAYVLKVAGPEGGISRILRRPFHPRPVTERMQEAERERRLTELEEGGGPQMRLVMEGPGGGGAQTVGRDAINEIMRGQVEQMQFYEELPVLMRLGTSWTGKIWAQRRGDAPTDGGPIDVMTTEGQYMGTFETGVTEIPEAFGPDGLAAYLETDEFDVPTIVVRRLPRILN
jgi:hypothetical protein